MWRERPVAGAAATPRRAASVGAVSADTIRRVAVGAGDDFDNHSQQSTSSNKQTQRTKNENLIRRWHDEGCPGGREVRLHGDAEVPEDGLRADGRREEQRGSHDEGRSGRRRGEVETNRDTT